MSRRQARLSEIFNAYDFRIEHLEGNKNPADSPSRRPDYEQGYDRPSARLLATKAEAELIKKDLPAEIIEVQRADQLAIDAMRKLTTKGATKGATEGATEPTVEHEWMVNTGALTFEGSVYVPELESL